MNGPILITDSEALFSEERSGPKILFNGTAILKSDFLNDDATSMLNRKLNALESIAAREMIMELREFCRTFPDFQANRFLETRGTSYDKAYSILYPYFKRYVIQRNYFLDFLKTLSTSEWVTKESSFELNFGKNFALLKTADLPDNCTLHLRNWEQSKSRMLFRRLFYAFHRLFRRQKVVRKEDGQFDYHILLVLYDTPNDIDLFRPLFQKMKDYPNVLISLLQLESSNLNVVPAHQFETENIRVYNFRDFKSPAIYKNRSFFRTLKKVRPEMGFFEESSITRIAEVHYAFLNEAISRLRPDLIWYDNTGEVGRYTTDVGRYYGIPVTNVEYSMFSNDFFHMASNIRYSARFCLGEESVKIWQSKEDPSDRYIPIGFLKLDSLPDHFDRAAICSKLGLSPDMYTLFFASTWAGSNTLYNLEKEIIVRELIAFSEKNGFQLIIKKHPAEVDDRVEQAFNSMNPKHAHLFQHNECNIYEVLSISNLSITQNSSVALEATLFDIPTVYYNLENPLVMKTFITMAEERFVHFINQAEELLPLIDYYNNNDASELFEDARKRYIVKFDKKVSERLIEQSKKLIDEPHAPAAQSPENDQHHHRSLQHI